MGGGGMAPFGQGVATPMYPALLINFFFRIKNICDPPFAQACSITLQTFLFIFKIKLCKVCDNILHAHKMHQYFFL